MSALFATKPQGSAEALLPSLMRAANSCSKTDSIRENVRSTPSISLGMFCLQSIASISDPRNQAMTSPRMSCAIRFSPETRKATRNSTAVLASISKS